MVPSGSTMVTLADDIALVVVGREERILTANANYILALLSEWLRTKWTEVAPEKTEAVTMAGRIRLRMEGTDESTYKVVKYLGIYINESLTFPEHLRTVKKNRAYTKGIAKA